MELESLKYIWHSWETPATSEQDRRNLLALVQKKSQVAVSRMRRNLIGEIIVLLVAYTPVILCFLLGFQGRLVAISWLFLLVLACFFIYYLRKYQLLNKLQCPTCQLRANLARQISNLKKYTRFYLIGGTGMIPVAYLFSYVIIRWKQPSAPIPVFWLLLLIPVTVALYFVNASYIRRLYGRHIKKLQELLRELDSE